MKTSLCSLRACLPLAAVFFSLPFASAQTVWTGGGGADKNWSTGANWSSGLAPAAFDTVQFGNSATVADAVTVNNTVNSPTGIDALSYTNATSGAWHVTEIPTGITLSAAGAVTVGGGNANGLVTSAAMVGGGSFVANGLAFSVGNQGSSSLNQNTILNLSGLSNFVYESMSGTLGVGAVNRCVATLHLAAGSNHITVATINLNTGSSSSSGNGVALRLGEGTNIINAGAINLAAGRTGGTVQFAGATGGLRLRGVGGGDSERANLTIGHRNAGSSSGGTTTGSLLLNGHPVDMRIETATVGRNSRNGSEAGLHGTGVLQYDQGVVDATTINMGVMSGTSPSSSANGTVTIGANGTLNVQNMSLVNMTSSGAGSTASGNLNIIGGLVNCSGNVVKTTAAGTGNVALDAGGRLNLAAEGRLGTAAAPLNKLAMTNAYLQVPILLGEASASAENFVLDGITNKLDIVGTLPPVTGYPASLPVIQYGTLSGTFNLGLGTLPPSTPAYAGYLSNNAANGSIDLVLTAGPMPARVLSWSGTSSADWDTASANWRFGAAAVTYNQGDFVLFSDTATGPTAVNLTGAMLPSNVIVSNLSKTYSFTGSGNLSGDTGITKDGAGTLSILNSGINDNTGALIINAGTVRVGDGNYAGNLGSGSIQNDGALVFNRADDITVSSSISGTGSLTKQGAGTLSLGAANTFTGPLTVVSGTLSTLNNAALGTIDGNTTVSSGAVLDVNGCNLGAEPVTVSGSGMFGSGVIINNGGQSLNALRYVTLTGDTVFGGAGRWDIRGAPSTADPANAGLSTGGNAYKLTKIGANQVSLVGVTVDPALGDIEVQGGILGVETATTSLGDPARTLTVFPGATLQFYNLTNQVNKRIFLTSDGMTPSINNAAGANTVVGPVTLNNDCFINVGGTALSFNGNLAGAVLTKNGGGDLVLGGTAAHAGTYVNVGKVVVNGSHPAGLTNSSLSSVAGAGTAGFADVSGNLFPGDTNVVGTITFQGLVLQPSAQIFMELGSSTTPGSGSNDLIQVNGDLVVNGNSITINPQGLLQTQVGTSYRLFNYTGNLVWNGDLYVTGPNNYSFRVDRATPGQINVIISGGAPVWNGASTSTSNWSDAANWGGIAVSAGTALYFGGTNRLVNNNDTPVDFLYTDLVFASEAGPFRLNGNSITLGNSIVNQSASTQTVNLNLSVGANATLNGASGPVRIGGTIANTANLSVLTLAGTGTLTNQFTSPSGMTNTLRMTQTNGAWTLVDNAVSSPVTVPMQLDIQAGILNFGEGASAPVLTSTTAGGLNARIGAIGGAPAIFNMVNGTLEVAARFNMGGAGDAIAMLNQSGGTINILDIFQGADSSATAVSTVNVSGGTLSVGEAESSPNTFFLCSRGAGNLTLSGSGLVRCGTFDVSRNASSASSRGTVNLNGGTLEATRIGTGTSSFGTGGTPSATFNFNGGTLKARASSTTFFQGRAELPITAIVQAGGALLDSAGFNISLLEPLQHDTALGETPDGGFTKSGDGTATLTAVSTYTGPTIVNAGTLALNGSLTVSAVTVQAGGTLTGSGNLGSSLTVNAGGTLSPGIMTVTNNVSLSGLTVMEISKTPKTNDLLRTIGGKLQYGGTLQVVLIQGSLGIGDTFQLFQAGGSYSGSFTTLDLPPLEAGRLWDTSRLSVDGTISVRGGLAVNTVTSSGGNLTISGANGIANATYNVLSSADAAAPLANWTVASTGQFDANGNFWAVIPIAPGTPKRFFVIHVP